MYLAWREHHMPPHVFAALPEGEQIVLLAFAEWEGGKPHA